MQAPDLKLFNGWYGIHMVEDIVRYLLYVQTTNTLGSVDNRNFNMPHPRWDRWMITWYRGNYI